MSFSALSQSTSGALAVTGKFDDLAGDVLFDVVVGVSDPQRDANKFEGNTEDTPGLGVELLAVKERGDRHSNASGGEAVVGNLPTLHVKKVHGNPPTAK
jgi:hypothetical protein